MTRSLGWWCGVLLFSATMIVGPMSVDAGGPRQYYGGWSRHATAGYYHRSLYYKPSPSYGGYKHHYCIYHPRRPNYYYFYNPYQRTYWGRCPVNYGDQPTYSMLAPEDRKPTLSEIPESAFPEPGPLPAVPETTDNERLELPPDDLPPEAIASGVKAIGPPISAN